MSNINHASQYFNTHWSTYQQALHCNTLYHREMTAMLTSFIEQHFSKRSFSFVDVGCGDASTIAMVLPKDKISYYIGIDAAPDVLKIASQQLAHLPCQKDFLCANMIEAITQIPDNIDVIYTSYALHHLSYAEKSAFIQACHTKLTPGGYFLMVDGVLNEGQSRKEWLQCLRQRIKSTQPISTEELDRKMQHPEKDDFPESISAFEAIANAQSWNMFDVLFKEDIFAFVMFEKQGDSSENSD